LSRLLVVRAGALGDTLMATPVVTALRRRYPHFEIDFLCSSVSRPLLELDPAISRLFELKLRNVPYLVSAEKRRLAGELRGRNYAWAVLLESAPAYRELLERAGIAEIRSITDSFDPHLHSIVNNLRAAGESGDDPPPMELHLGAEDEARAAAWLAGWPRPWIGMHAGWGPPRRKGRREDRLKSWRVESFRKLAGLLKGSIVLTGGPDDVAPAQRLAEGMSPAPLLLVGRTSVRELAAVIKRLDLLISVDSGPAHMAAALGTPLVVLWGPAILEQVRPMGDPARIRVVREPVPCAPCYGTALMKSCRRNVCMEGITPERVAAEAAGLLPNQ
jgi:ADP-heptose:LPS heptosyltransferase